MLPLLFMLLWSVYLGIYAVTLNVNCSVNSLKKLVSLLRASVIFVSIISLCGAFVDIFLIQSCNWLAYFWVILFRALIFLSIFKLIKLQYVAAKGLSEHVLTFHDFIVNYRQAPVKKEKTYRGSLATIEEAESKYEQSELPVNAHGVRESVLNHYSQIFFIDDEERSMYIDEDEEKNYGMTLEVSQDFPFNRALSEIKDYQNKPTLDL